jgi:sugar phosphate isomerase/epimerase
VGLALENMLPHLFFGNMRDMLWIIGAIDSPIVGACLDTGHAFLAGDISKIMYKLSGHLQFLHANDNMGQLDEHLPPGKGKIDWKQVLYELNEIDFEGALMLELMGNSHKSTEEVMAEARQSRRFLRDLSRRLTQAAPPTVRGAARNIGQ